LGAGRRRVVIDRCDWAAAAGRLVEIRAGARITGDRQKIAARRAEGDPATTCIVVDGAGGEKVGFGTRALRRRGLTERQRKAGCIASIQRLRSGGDAMETTA